MKRIEGIAASPGVAIGPAYVHASKVLDYERYSTEDSEGEWRRFEEAAEAARQELEMLRAKVQATSGEEEAAIFGAQMMMLDDPEFRRRIRERLEKDSVNVEVALVETAEDYARRLEDLQDEYLSARADDIRDVMQRVLRHLLGLSGNVLGPNRPSIVVARDLTPSDTAALDRSLVLGFCTAEGGATDHTAILARAMGLPALVGAGEGITTMKTGEVMIVDGSKGCAILDPDASTSASYESRRTTRKAVLAWAQTHAHEQAITRDGREVEIVANVGDVQDARQAVAYGAEGVGLLRTEFLYLERSELPGEDEQCEAYSEIATALEGRPVIVRSLDVGGDKQLAALDLPKELNPFLGQRALRLALAHPQDLLKPQLRAVLRTAAHHPLKLMFPMVATVSEVQSARALLEECRSELLAEGHAVPDEDEMEVGIMIEIPAAAIMAERLAEEVDFFSIGTNDLTQYTMAADRTNPSVSYLLSGLQPAVLHLVRMVVYAAHTCGNWVGMCGELAGESLAIPILLGLGLDEFSMNPPAIPLAKQIIRALTMKEARSVAEEALNQDHPEAVEALVRRRLAAVDMEYLLSLRKQEASSWTGCVV